jgi:hypothetical protein
MEHPHRPRWIVPILALLAILVPALALARGSERDAREAWGKRFESQRDGRGRPEKPSPPAVGATQWLRHWNQVAIDASGLDHTPVAPGEARIFGEQFGPGRAARAMAIVHIAMFDSLNAIVGGYRGYTRLPHARPGTSIRAALSQSAHDTLVDLFPSQRATFDTELEGELGQVPSGRAKANGMLLGRRAAAAILSMRADDGSQHAEPLVDVEWPTSPEPGHWRQDPISQIPLALGAYWGKVRPFVLRSGDQFRAPAPPALDSEEYAQAFDEAARLGGDGAVTPTERTDDQSFIGVFWAYDGTPSLCAPPRLYNQILQTIAEQEGSSAIETARLFALANVAMADAGIAVWESKYHWDFWRPITGIREAPPGVGPVADPAFTPLGAPASNLVGPNFTPPFPAYPSGHAGFGGALFQTLRRFYGRDDITFTFVSDEWNGITLDNEGTARPLIPRTFSSFSEAEEENGQSRIYLGIHWSFDKTEGIAQGRSVADYVFDRAFRPLRPEQPSPR